MIGCYLFECGVLPPLFEESLPKKRFIDDMDAAFQDGKYVSPNEGPPSVKFRDMNNYCKQVGKKPVELTDEEMEQFRF